MLDSSLSYLFPRVPASQETYSVRIFTVNTVNNKHTIIEI